MANKVKVGIAHKKGEKRHFESDCSCLPNIGDEIVDPIAGLVIVRRKIWNFDDPDANLVTFDTEASPYPPI
ncbi:MULTISPECIES: hypothetical protein [Pseudomonas]|uniref:Uncharacterized protein n=1 Tax=Pseudomonas gessardii TaxID=78544 RepID=A0A7Y1MVL8_9PSED|nr:MULTISPECIES: hypothetical protein [Pseudomonas]MBH3422573.1 hypothetical protein [Pseudomonas gessardii]MCF4977501.1 hypothetical protein [Pseudomonas gessardii]MCF4992717.1 hypothetical protein [Pseudomonas gessardii]MCF5083688.1 hypothetical protein [Pseudomonas gessardii]MCF5105629.1 hypothetical protein [Pseudomonas gessardii]